MKYVQAAYFVCKGDNVSIPLHAKRNEEIKDFLWNDAPKRQLGSHDGFADTLRKFKGDLK